MIALYIVLGVLAVILFVLLMPVSLDFSFEEKTRVTLKFLGICVFDNEKSTGREQKAEPGDKKEGFLGRLKREKGFLGAFKYCLQILGIIIKRAVWLVKRFEFRDIKLSLTVATEDAAKTAVGYGGICAVLYPMASFLETVAGYHFKKIDISSDFDSIGPRFCISFKMSVRIIYIIIAAFAFLRQYRRLNKKESEKNERKQH